MDNCVKHHGVKISKHFEVKKKCDLSLSCLN